MHSLDWQEAVEGAIEIAQAQVAVVFFASVLSGIGGSSSHGAIQIDHVEADDLVSVEQGKAIAAQLRGEGQVVELHEEDR